MKIPPMIDRRTFEDLCSQQHGAAGHKVDAAVFIHSCNDDGQLSRDELVRLSNYTDLFLSHESGIDCHGRYTADRVKKLDVALRKHGLLTWLGDTEAAKAGGIFDARERSRRGVENTQVVLCFITRRYSNLIERNLSVNLNINLDAGAGSASADSGELCGLEFEHAVAYRGKGYLRSIVPCVLEKDMRDPSAWCPRLRDVLAGRFIVDLSSVESEPTAVSEFCTFITCAVGTPLMQGGPFGLIKAREHASTRGRHYRWLRENCGLNQPQARRYTDTFEKYGIHSIARLFHLIEQDTHYLSKITGAAPEEISCIEKAIRRDVQSNITPANQIDIDKIYARRRAAEALTASAEDRRLEMGTAWIRQVHEDEEMGREDRHSRSAVFDDFLGRFDSSFKTETHMRHREAIDYDCRLREGEEMTRESLAANLIRQTELQRRRDLADMCTLQTAREAAEHTRRIAGKLATALQSGSRPSNAVESLLGTDKFPTLVDQLVDSNWHRLLEEIVGALHMLQRLASGGTLMQQDLQDKGVLKVLLLLISPCCTNTTNMFLIPSHKTRPFLTAPLPAPLDTHPVNTSISICGVDAIRYLCRSCPDSTDMSGNNDRNIFLLGEAGAIEVVCDIIKQHLRACKRANLLKQQFAPLLQGRDPRRARLVGAGLPGGSSAHARHGGRFPSSAKTTSSYAAVSHTESLERSTQAVYSALECLFSLAGRTQEHPNKARLARAGALDIVLMCTAILTDSSIVFQWAGRLILLLFNETTDKNLNGRLCKMLTEQLQRFVTVPFSCAGGSTAISHLSFVAALTEVDAVEEEDNSSAKGASQSNLLAAAAAAVARVKNDVTYWLREKKACTTCLQAISLHYSLDGQSDPEGGAVVAAAARAIGNLCYHQPATREVFSDSAAVRTLIDAARIYVQQPRVLAELLFAMGNVVDMTKSCLPSSSSTCRTSASVLLVSGGAVEILQSGLIYSRTDADLCLQGLFCFSKLIHGVIDAQAVSLVQRIICIGTCDQVCHAMRAHPTRLDIYISGCQAIETITTSPFDGATGGTQRILRAGVSEVLVRGIRTSLSAAQTILASASVAQSGYTAIDNKSGRNDLLLFSGAAYFTGCSTCLMLLKSIRPKEFFSDLQAQGLVGTISGSSPARVRAMMLQVKRCHDQGLRVAGFLLSHAAVYIQAACDANYLSEAQAANCATTNSPYLYPRRMELFPLRSPVLYERNLSCLFDLIGIGFDDWSMGKD